MIELILFENSAHKARKAISQGIRSFLIDWESAGKAERQKGFDTEILPGTVNDLKKLSSIEDGQTWCRINSKGSDMEQEVEAAIDAGAHGIFLPMVKSPLELEKFLEFLKGRCESGFLLETQEAFDCARYLAKLPCDRVFFGLNDFAISRGGGNIFLAVADGSVEHARDIFKSHVFGFGGLTALSCGSPIPCNMLLEEMVRLDCHFTFLRRSFRHDTRERDPAAVVMELEGYWKRCRERTPEAELRDHEALSNWILGVAADE